MNLDTRTDPLPRTHEILRLVSANRGLCYSCLAGGFSYPDESLAARLNSGRFGQDFLAGSAWLGEDRLPLEGLLAGLQACAGAGLGELQADYSRFFETSMERISPHEASYRWQDAAHLADMGRELGRSLQHQYSQFGVFCTPGMEDHVAAELEFLTFLCRREKDAWAAGSARAARSLRSQQRTFVDDHLSRWLPVFLRRLHRRAGASFYGRLARLCDEWLSLDQGQGYEPIVD